MTLGELSENAYSKTPKSNKAASQEYSIRQQASAHFSVPIQELTPTTLRHLEQEELTPTTLRHLELKSGAAHV